RGIDVLDEPTVIAREALDLMCADRMEAPSRLGWALAQGDRDQAAWLEHVDQLSERACALARRNVHPDRREQNDVERGAETRDARQCGQPVVDPANARMRVSALALFAHAARRLGRNHLEAPLRKPRRIAARACAEIGRA